MSCINCGGPSKYKCPVCLQPYCSVACCKKHKKTPCRAPTPPTPPEVPKEPTIHYEFPTEDTVAPEKLKLLEQSAELKKCLENPHVREILEKLDKSTHPDMLIQEYMQEPTFIEFVDVCFNVVQSPQDDY